MYKILETFNQLTREQSEPVYEKWGTETKVSPAEKGKYAGKTKSELLKSYNALKKSGPHKKGSAEYGKMRELAFAIRAKSDWGKVDESDIEQPRHPQELDYQAGPEDDEQYRRHHGLDDPDRQQERKLRATDYKTLDRLERQAVDRAKQIDEEPNEGNEFSGELAKAKASGAKEFEVDGKTYPVKESEVEEGRNDPHPLDDPITRFRKKFAPSVMRDPEARGELSKLDTEYGERRKTGYGRGEDEDEGDEEGTKKDKPAGEKRGRGRPKGTTRRIGAKGPTGRSKLLTREDELEEDYDQDEYDEEGEMAQSQARTIEDAAEELQSILDADENLPEWVQKKITLAKEYIDSARDYLKANRPEEDEMDIEVDDEEMVAEKAVSQAQRRAAGIAYAAKKGDIPKSELRGASKEMAKMAGGELKKFAKTKEKGLPAKKDESMEEDKPDFIDIDKDGDRSESMKKAAKDKQSDEKVDETTTAGSVATGAESNTSKGIFGKGVYESAFDEAMQQVEESLNVSTSSSTEGEPTITVTASGEHAPAIMELLKMAGIGPESEPCSACGQSACGCETVEEDLANSADNTENMSMDYLLKKISGGLNREKLQVNPNNPGDNPLAMSALGKTAHTLNLGETMQDVQEKTQQRLMDLYRQVK